MSVYDVRDRIRAEIALQKRSICRRAKHRAELAIGFELSGVIGTGFEKRVIVVHNGGDEMIVKRILADTEFAVDKKTFHPSVSDAARITSKINPLWKFVDASQTSLKNRKLIFAQLRSLINGNDVILLSLVAQNVSC